MDNADTPQVAAGLLTLIIMILLKLGGL